MTKQLSNLVLDPEKKRIRSDVKKTAKPKDKIDKTVLQNSMNLETDALHSFEYDGFRWSTGTVDPESQKIKMQDQVFAHKYTDTNQIGDF